MKDKWFDYITQVTLLLLIMVLAFAITRIVKLEKEVNNQEITIKDLQKRIINHEDRLEDIKPNDDFVTF